MPGQGVSPPHPQGRARPEEGPGRWAQHGRWERGQSRLSGQVPAWLMPAASSRSSSRPGAVAGAQTDPHSGKDLLTQRTPRAAPRRSCPPPPRPRQAPPPRAARGTQSCPPRARCHGPSRRPALRRPSVPGGCGTSGGGRGAQGSAARRGPRCLCPPGNGRAIGRVRANQRGRRRPVSASRAGAGPEGAEAEGPEEEK